MSGYQFTPQAEDDLFEIWSYIAAENPGAVNDCDIPESLSMSALRILC